MSYIRILIFSTILIFASTSLAQPPVDWYLQDPSTSGFYGIALERLQEELHKNSEAPRDVVVAIIDTGIDHTHEDLKGQIWHNSDEVADNDIDDDGNGYVDDIHGWNFLGNAEGENVINETLEVTRLYAKYSAYFKDADIEDLSKKDQQLYDQFLEFRRIVEKEREKARKALAELEATENLVLDALDAFDDKYPGQELNDKFLKNFKPKDNQQLQIAEQIFHQAIGMGFELTTLPELRDAVAESFTEAKIPHENDLDYMYNPDFDSREIIGDDYSDSSERDYGNNQTAGEFAFHGTHVGGIVGARADNDLGSRGVAENVKLMSLRVVPDGDEHDKDVANAIFYAVDNGATVINMSFGKGYSWDKSIVDKAVKYARKNDVLLVHAAGNGSMNNDSSSHYPIPVYEKSCFLFGRKKADNWLEVGALSPTKGEDAVASFSHYGKTSVDVFAPGDFMLSCAPDNTYRIASGTSAAAPVVSGVAALLRSYFPSLTAQQVREIIMESVTPVEGKVRKPGTDELVPMSDLCISGGAVNAYRAFQLASETKGKKKVKLPEPESERRA